MTLYRPERRPGTPRSLAWAAALAVLLTTTPDLFGQSLLSVEGSLPYARPVSTFADQGADPGIGLGGQAVLRLFSPVFVYAGWDRTSFDCPACAGDADVSVDGFVAGMEAQLNPEGRWRPWFRAGMARRSVEAETGSVGAPDAWAIQVGAGLLAWVVPALDVRAGARFETLDPELDLGTDPTELGTPLSYLAIELAVRVRVLR